MFYFTIFVYCIAVASCKYNVFQNNTVNLNYSEIAFFETPDYPMLHNYLEFWEYNVTFYTTETSGNGTRCVLVLQGLGRSPKPYININEIFIFNTARYFLETYKYMLQQYNAFSGYLYFEDWDSSCPFESLSRETPYKFTDETEIIFIQANYQNITVYGNTPENLLKTDSCNWKFSAPNGYGFKVVILNFNMSGSSHFQIYNSTELLVNERSVKINHGYYNADNFIQINLMKDNVTTTQFNAYISVVKQNFAKLDGSCIVTNQINGSFTWASNANLSNGYDNNIVCNFAVIVPHGTSYLATVDQYSVETGVDHLNYDDGEYDFELNYHYQFVLESYSDGTNGTYFFEFITDGSYTASGFVINFVKNVCECADPIISCNNIVHTVMKSSASICPNLICSFTIQPCETPFIHLSIKAADITEFDFIKVYSNETLIFNTQLINLKSPTENVYLKSENKNIMEVSIISRSRKNVTFSVSSFLPPPIDAEVVLTINSSMYVLDQSATTFASIKLDKKLASQNYSIIVSGTRNRNQCNKDFFNDKNLSKKINFEKCALTTDYRCDSQREELFYFVNHENKPENQLTGCFTAFTLSKNTENCVFVRTVFFVEDGKKVSALSSHNGECFITFFVDPSVFYSITNIFTTSVDENVQVYYGIENNLFFEFNSQTLRKWNNIQILAGQVYSMKIPRSASVLLTLTEVKLPLIHKIGMAPYYSLVSTPYYGSNDCTNFYYYGSFITYNIGNVKLKFTLLEINASNSIYILANNLKIRINEIGKHFTFQNQNVSLFMDETSKCGALFYVESTSETK